MMLAKQSAGSLSTHRESTQRGFALVIVLWVLAGLTVIAVVVASSARVSSESVKLLRERVQAEAAFLSTSSRIRVIAATGQAGRIAIDGSRGRLLADGRNTLVAPGETVAVQDARGLVDLNRNRPEQLAALLQRCGASDTQTVELIDSLADYIDRDNVKRLNGGEAFDYRLVGLPEPRNAALLSREELWRVKGWLAIRKTWKSAACDEFVTTYGDGRFNSNTASASLLQTAGMTAEAANAMVEARREGFDLLVTQIAQGIPSDSFLGSGGGFVGDTIRVSHRLSSIDWILVYDLQLTPSRDGGPWRIHEIRYRSRPNQAVQTLAELPAPDFELSASQPNAPNASSSPPFAN